MFLPHRILTYDAVQLRVLRAQPVVAGKPYHVPAGAGSDVRILAIFVFSFAPGLLTLVLHRSALAK